MRKFYLINEKNIRYNLQDIRNSAFLTDTSGLGYDNGLHYVKVGNTFKLEAREQKQDVISAIINFQGYDKYQEFINYIESSENLRLIYKPIDAEYYRDVDFDSISKTEKSGLWLRCSIRFNCKGLYYTEDNKRFTLETIQGESRWPLPLPFTFNDYSSISIEYNNLGHTDSEMLAEIYGYISRPAIELYVDGKLKYKVLFDVVVEIGQRLLYSAKDGDNYVMLEDTDGTQTNIVKCLKLENDNFFKIPKGQSILKVTSDTGVLNKAVFRILTAYKGV